MNTYFKKVTIILIICLFVSSFSVVVYAEETVDLYALEREMIYSQLEAQNALHLYDHFVNILIPTTSDSSDQGIRANGFPYSAPNGAVLGYKYDYTYRGEDGFVYSVINYMLPDNTAAYFRGDSPTVGSIVYDVIGSYPSAFSFMFDYFALVSGAELIQAGWSVEAADGYGKICTAYDSISDSAPTVVVGWADHPTVVAPRSDAYEITIRIAN